MSLCQFMHLRFGCCRYAFVCLFSYVFVWLCVCVFVRVYLSTSVTMYKWNLKPEGTDRGGRRPQGREGRQRCVGGVGRRGTPPPPLPSCELLPRASSSSSSCRRRPRVGLAAVGAQTHLPRRMRVISRTRDEDGRLGKEMGFLFSAKRQFLALFVYFYLFSIYLFIIIFICFVFLHTYSFFNVCYVYIFSKWAFAFSIWHIYHNSFMEVIYIYVTEQIICHDIKD